MSVRSLAGRLGVTLTVSALAGCGSFFESSIPAPQAYVLRLPPPATRAAGASAASVRVQRPEAGPGLDSDRIVLLRSDRRFDFYAASRWAASAPDLMESVLVDQLRAAGTFDAVLDDSSPYPPHYNLRCSLARFESDYTEGGHAPVAKVALDCSFGRHRDRALLTNFTAQGSAPASDDRLGAVVAAFESATAQAVGQLEKEIADGLAAEKAPAPPRRSEGG
jgi:cholesterol transport system auxiliary component